MTMPVDVTILDFSAGRIAGGHSADYVSALERAFGRPAIAPYRDGWAPSGRMAGRIAQVRTTFACVLGAPVGGRVLAIQQPGLGEVLALILADLTVGQRRRWVATLVLRRDAAGMLGRQDWRARLYDRAVRRLIARGRVHPVSDSRLALDHWTDRGRAAGDLLVIPRPTAAVATPMRGSGFKVGLVGGCRIEKGSRQYARVIASARRTGAAVTVQIGPGADAASLPFIDDLLARYGSDPEVELIDWELDASAYAGLVASCDAVVLPYESERYGSGTSGVMSDALALGCVVLCTRFPWALGEYDGDPRVEWLDGLTDADLDAGLAAARRRAEQDLGHLNVDADDEFARRWRAAVANANARL
jgi:glycosyltransferase involved in cell wall biosynthesis